MALQDQSATGLQEALAEQQACGDGHTVELTSTVQAGLLALEQREASINAIFERLLEEGFAAMDAMKAEFAEGVHMLRGQLAQGLEQTRASWTEQSASLVQCYKRLDSLRNLASMLNAAVHTPPAREAAAQLS